MPTLTVQHNTSPYLQVLHSTVQYSTVQYSTVQHITVQHSTVQHITVQHSTVQDSTVQYSTVQDRTVQHSTAHYSTASAHPVLPGHACLTLTQPTPHASTQRLSLSKCTATWQQPSDACHLRPCGAVQVSSGQVWSCCGAWAGRQAATTGLMC